MAYCDSGFDFLSCVLQLLSLLEDLACFGINKVAGIAITGVDVVWLAVIKRYLSSMKGTKWFGVQLQLFLAEGLYDSLG